jgi:hypothetical protein
MIKNENKTVVIDESKAINTNIDQSEIKLAK